MFYKHTFLVVVLLIIIFQRKNGLIFYVNRWLWLAISCELSAKQTFHMKCRSLFSQKNKKKNIS